MKIGIRLWNSGAGETRTYNRCSSLQLTVAVGMVALLVCIRGKERQAGYVAAGATEALGHAQAHRIEPEVHDGHGARGIAGGAYRIDADRDNHV